MQHHWHNWTGRVVAGSGVPAHAQSDVKIGFVTTFSGPAAAVGNDMRDAFELALDHLGPQDGRPQVTMIYEDDEPQAGVKASRRPTS